MSWIRILLVDDHSQLRSLIRARLEREPDITIIGEATTGEETVQMTRRLKPEIVLIDPMIEDGLGLRAMEEIAHTMPSTRQVVLTAVIDTALRIQLQEIGVSGIFTKGMDSEQLIAALRHIQASSVVH